MFGVGLMTLSGNNWFWIIFWPSLVKTNCLSILSV